MNGDYGCLYVVATPIGNLDDLSPRAARVLGSVGRIAAEDTRAAKHLLQYVGVGDAALLSCHEHNEERRVGQLLEDLHSGMDVALISEAGTPGISDPGFRLVRAAHNSGIPVRAIPGPSAAIAALSVSGLPTDRFAFLGFPPRGKKLRGCLEEWMQLEMTLVLYQAPTRILKTLETISSVDCRRPICVAREVTKIYEDARTGEVSQVLAHYRRHGDQLRGEFTLVISPEGYRLCGEVSSDHPLSDADRAIIEPLWLEEVDLLVRGGYKPSQAVGAVARGHNVQRSMLYRAYQEWRNEGKYPEEG